MRTSLEITKIMKLKTIALCPKHALNATITFHFFSLAIQRTCILVKSSTLNKIALYIKRDFASVVRSLVIPDLIFTEVFEKKKGYVLPKAMMVNVDHDRIINSNEVQRTRSRGPH
ncbi:60S ribosomal protein L4, C-terminal domain [Dillenia turbinata]|uniref:60S ribosomal protein L4, C-terminal domain n=1 Tax=Dillenia turbinata TaxID=194707 RepID=A0AAN8V134_9MAGN